MKFLCPFPRHATLLALLFLAVAHTAVSQDAGTKFRLAQTFEQTGDYERAARLYRELLEADPKSVPLFEGLQRVLIQLKRYDEVILLVQKRLASAPGDLNLRTTLAGIYQRSGREQEAQDEWDRAIALNPANPNSYRIVASSMMELRLLDRAVEIYRRGQKACGDSVLFALELAQLQSVMMDYTGASRELLRWLQRNPSQMAFVQGRMAAFVGKPDGRKAAMAVVGEALRDHEEVHFDELLAWLHLEGKEFGEAFELERRIDELTHARGSALLQFAHQAQKAGALEIAIRAYQEAMAVPVEKLSEAQFGYAGALAQLAGESDTLSQPLGAPWETQREAHPGYQDAIAAYQAVIRNFPHSQYSARSYYQIGVIQLERLFDLDGALRSFQKVGEEAGSVSAIRYAVALKVGIIDVARGDTAQAFQEFARVARAPDAIPDQSDEALFHCAELDFYAGRFERAISELDSISINLKADEANDAIALRAFLEENRTSAPAALRLYGRAEFLARQHKNSEAIAVLQQVVQEYPTSLLVDDALMRIGTLQRGAGMFNDALATYARLLTQFKEQSILLDRAQFAIAETWQFGLHEKSRAIQEYEQLLAEYPRSLFAGIARKRIRMLRGDAL
jgi:tetratricopeptide (TPR) repeat protein